MGETEQNKILSRVKKMMNLANDAGATEGERDNALRMAYATLAKYNLDMAQVDEAALMSGGKKAPDEKRERVDNVFYGVCWTRAVSMAIARLFFCEYFYCKDKGPSDFRITHSFVGRTANAITASEMAAYIVASIDKESKKHARDAFYQKGRAQRDFAKGAVERIVRRCYELRAAAEKAPVAPSASGPGTALVLASFYDSEKKANEKALVTMGLRVVVSKSRERSASNYDSYNRGREFGSKINLDRQVR